MSFRAVMADNPRGTGSGRGLKNAALLPGLAGGRGVYQDDARVIQAGNRLLPGSWRPLWVVPRPTGGWAGAGG